jgi:hypothetical protein
MTAVKCRRPTDPILIQLGIIWLTLHAPGGHEISINAKRITAMRAGEGGDKNVLLTGAVRCVISMDDGKLVNVVETCGEVRDQIQVLEDYDK